jgi:hypothetical protein
VENIRAKTRMGNQEELIMKLLLSKTIDSFGG